MIAAYIKNNEEFIGVSFGLVEVENEDCFIGVRDKESQIVVRQCVSECSNFEMWLLFLERKTPPHPPKKNYSKNN